MRRIIFSLVFLCYASFSVIGITWKEVVSLAEKNGYALKSTAYQTEAARLGYYRSFSSYLPQLSLSASLGETTAGTLAASARSTAYGLSITQPLFTGLDNYYGSRLAKINYEYYLALQKKNTADFYLELRRAFIDLAIAHENLELLKSIRERRKNNAEMIKLRYESGREDLGALKRAEADLVDAEFALSVETRAEELAKLKLKQLISAEVDKIEDELQAKAPENVDFDQLLEQVPSLIMSVKQLEQAEINWQQTLSEFLPNLSLSASYRKSGSDWPPTSDSSSWTLSFSYPFFPGGSNLVDRIMYAVKYEQAKQDFYKTKDDLRYALASFFKEYKDAVEALNSARLYLEASSLRAEIARAKYMNGLMDYDEWDRIENDYINYQKSFLAKKKAALYAEAAWHNAYGGYVK